MFWASPYAGFAEGQTGNPVELLVTQHYHQGGAQADEGRWLGRNLTAGRRPACSATMLCHISCIILAQQSAEEWLGAGARGIIGGIDCRG